MKRLNSRQRILCGVWAMVLAIIGDYLLGYKTFNTNGGSEAYLGISWNVAPDWRYAVSSVLGFACAALFAVGAVELMRVLEQRYHLGDSIFYKLFRIANWSGILYFAFIHIGICMLPVVFNAGMAATNDVPAAADMTLRVLKSIAVPLVLGFLLCDGLVAVGWFGMILKRQLPLPKAAVLCNPVVLSLVGQVIGMIAEGMDSGTESFGWLLMYLVCAVALTGSPKGGREERAA